ncbi:hypothetical protein [Kribbella sp. NPDC050459]|jgi:lysylphosphatidylglycerol synthetase-like protein (DUF2156 family)|uniref:DUF7144 family membrane protein n=1 Tax=Kribbella sp. NPDC050459 TaxID=3155785 RepID=UPI00340957B2
MAAKRAPGAMAGLVVFAGVMLVVIGLVNVFEGFVALIKDERLVIAPDKLIVVDVTGWGWFLLISGLVLLAVGCGLLAAQTWARITAIIVVGLHVVLQIVSIGAYPVWSLLMIALDTAVLYALTAGWSGARERIERRAEATWNGQEGEVPQSAAEQRVPPMR